MPRPVGQPRPDRCEPQSESQEQTQILIARRGADLCPTAEGNGQQADSRDHARHAAPADPTDPLSQEPLGQQREHHHVARHERSDKGDRCHRKRQYLQQERPRFDGESEQPQRSQYET